jgi:hypothetical protein
MLNSIYRQEYAGFEYFDELPDSTVFLLSPDIGLVRPSLYVSELSQDR